MKKIGMLLLSIMCITSCNNTTSTTSNTSIYQSTPTMLLYKNATHYSLVVSDVS